MTEFMYRDLVLGLRKKVKTLSIISIVLAVIIIILSVMVCCAVGYGDAEEGGSQSHIAGETTTDASTIVLAFKIFGIMTIISAIIIASISIYIFIQHLNHAKELEVEKTESNAELPHNPESDINTTDPPSQEGQ